MIDDMMIGPIILDEHMTGQNFLDFLQNGLPEQREDVPLDTRIAMYFQDDKAPSHYTQLVWQHLNDTFHNWWISRSIPLTVPPRSPDLTLLDFCLWSWMKSEVYIRKVDTRDKLLDLIMDVIAHLKEYQDALRQVTCYVLTRVAECIDVDNGIFKNILY
jgi:hypothetical protein